MFCPECGGAVHPRASRCRCGAALASQPASGSAFAAGALSALGLVGLVAAAVGAVFWLTAPPPAAVRPEWTGVALPEPTETAASLAAGPLVAPLEAPHPPEPPAPEPTARPAPSLEEVVGRAMPAVVLVETAEGRGSGFFVTADTLVTNAHVVGGHPLVTVRRMSGEATAARVETVAAPFDLAILKLAAPVPGQPTIALAAGRETRVGQEVIAIGSALGTLPNTVTRGIVSGIRQSGHVTLVQTDAAVNPGNSGGPLLDRDGAAVGITTMGYDRRQGLNFAVAIDHARALLDGRPVPPVALPFPSAPGSVGPAQTRPSQADLAREAGLHVYARTVEALAARAVAMDAEWRRFRDACYRGPLPSVSRPEWVVLLSEISLPGAVAPGCHGYFGDLKEAALTFRGEMLAADEAARRAGVYPGARREIRRRHGLDQGDWER